MEIPALKVCRGCALLKPLDEFGTDKYTSDRKASRCILCKRQESVVYRTNNGNKVRAANTTWKSKNPDKIHAYEQTHKTEKQARGKAHYLQNKALMNAQSAAYYQTHKAEMRQKHAEWEANHRPERNASLRRRYAQNPAKPQAKARDYYWQNREKMLAQNALYFATHPDAGQTKRERRRAAKAQTSLNDLTTAQWQEIKDAYGHRCVYCHRKMQRLTQDHITPLSKGGAHTKTNVVPACQPCNSKKRDKAPLVPVQPLLFTIAPSKPHTKRRKD